MCVFLSTSRRRERKDFPRVCLFKTRSNELSFEFNKLDKRSTNLGDFSKDVAMIASLQQHEAAATAMATPPPPPPPDIEQILDAARKLCCSYSDFLRYVEPDCVEPRQNLFSAVGKIGEAGNEVIRSINRTEAYADSHEPKLQVSSSSLSLSFYDVSSKREKESFSCRLLCRTTAARVSLFTFYFKS